MEGVTEGIGCGPRLVADGVVAVNPEAEGFSSPKILSVSGARSAVGVTADGCLLLAVTSGTIRQLAAAMQGMGARNAMNLDGGASSGLWLRGRYLATPGRLVSNALMVLPK